jgi:acyl-CoA hydrolase
LCINPISNASNGLESNERSQLRLEMAQRRLALAEERARLKAEELRLASEAREKREQRKSAEIELKQANAQTREQRSELRESKISEFVKIKVFCHPLDIGTMKTLVLSCAMLRIPTIKLSDVWLNTIPNEGHFHSCLAAPEDADVIRKVGQNMYTARFPPIVRPAGAPPKPIPTNDYGYAIPTYEVGGPGEHRKLSPEEGLELIKDLGKDDPE